MMLRVYVHAYTYYGIFTAVYESKTDNNYYCYALYYYYHYYYGNGDVYTI